MKKHIFTLCLAIFSVCLSTGYAQEIRNPQNSEDEFIPISEPMLGFPPGIGNDEIPDFKFGFRSNFDTAILNEVALRAAARRNLRNWYDRQTGIIEKILEGKYNKSFPSFNAAKDHAFLEYEKPSIDTYATPLIRSNVGARNQRAKKKENTG